MASFRESLVRAVKLARNQKIEQQRNEKELELELLVIRLAVMDRIYPRVSSPLFSLCPVKSRAQLEQRRRNPLRLLFPLLSRSYPSILLAALPPPRGGDASSSFLLEVSFQFHHQCAR